MSKVRRYMTVREVAANLGFKPRTVARWCREGKLDAIKVGRVWRIPHSDFLGPKVSN